MRAALTTTILVIVFASCLHAQESSGAAKNTTLQGCLHYGHGHYSLIDSSGKAHLLAGTSKLKPHVGHEVEITGTEGTHSTSTTEPGAASTVRTTPVFKVSDVKHIADTCSAGTQK